MTLAILLVGIYPKGLKAVSKTHMHTHVHSSITHNSQKVEASQMAMDGRLDKQNVAYTYNGILITLEKQILTNATP